MPFALKDADEERLLTLARHDRHTEGWEAVTQMRLENNDRDILSIPPRGNEVPIVDGLSRQSAVGSLIDIIFPLT
jgi:hypothetical protein